MKNVEIAEILEQTARLLEVRQGDSAPVKEMYDLASRVARLEVPLELFEGVAPHSEGGRELAGVFSYWFAGFSLESSQVFYETVTTGSSRLRRNLRREVPPALQDLLKIKSLSVDKILELGEDFDVFDVFGLKAACKRKLFSTEGFLSATEELDLLKEIREFERRVSKGNDPQRNKSCTTSAPLEDKPDVDDEKTMFHANADALANFIIKEIRALKTSSKYGLIGDEAKEIFDSVKRSTLGVVDELGRFFTPRSVAPHKRAKVRKDEPFAGSAHRQGVEAERLRKSAGEVVRKIVKVGALRRGQEALSRLDFLIETEESQEVFARIKEASWTQEVLEEKPNFLSVKLNPKAFDMPYNARPTPETTLNFYTATEFVLGAREVFLTSSKKHWELLKKRATERGLTLTSMGLYRGVQRVTSRSVVRLYEKLGLPLIPEELREGVVEEEWIQKGRPERVATEDICGDLHMHTSFSDGTSGLEETATCAANIGLSYIATTDHSKSAPYVSGLDDSQVLNYWEAVDETNELLRRAGTPVHIFKGVEVDILENGSLDLRDETLAKADWVVASLHSARTQPFHILEQRYLCAFRNPFVDVIAHPTGRVIGREAPLNLDLDFFCENARKYDKFLELNSQPRRLDLCFEGLVSAKKRGVRLVISTDAHAPEQMTYVRFGVQLARRAGLTGADVVNTLSLDEFRKLLSQRKSRQI